MKRQLFLFHAVLVFQLLMTSDAVACSCGPRPTISDVLGEKGYVKTVVTGRIESLHKLREKNDEYDHQAYLSATLLVDKVYRGNIKPGDRLVLAQGSGSDCRFPWDEKWVGSEWLFYLGEPSTGHRPYFEIENEELLRAVKKTSMYGTSFCGRSTTVSSAARDLAYLDNLTKLKGRSRVSGGLDFPDDENFSVEGIEVRLTGKEWVRKAKYGKHGFFEIYDVPPGEYVLEIVPPRGWVAIDDWRSRQGFQEFPDDALSKLKKNQRLIRVSKGGHTDVDLSLTYDTKLAGRVLSPSGKPMPKVCLDVEPISDKKDERGGQSCTDEKGEFSITHLRPGNYFLVANKRGKIDADQPFSTLYFPGVPERSEVGIVAVEFGGYHLGIDFQISALNRLTEISGRVLFADDKPADDVWVKFEPASDEKYSAESVRTDSEGRFRLKVPFGASGKVSGSKYFSDYSHPNCSVILALAKKSSSDLKTSELELDGTRSVTEAVLRFPVDFCEKKKDN